jgi:hypothetical protein
MIKGITQHGRYIQVSNGSGANSLPYLNSSSNDPAMGDVRVINGQLSCWTSSSWQPIVGAYTSVGLTGEAEMLLDWAKEQKDKEQKRKQLIRDNPALQNAYEAIKKAESNFDIIEKFVGNDNNNAGVMRSP